MATDLKGYLTCVPRMGCHSLIIFKNAYRLPICDANIGGYAHWKGSKYILHMVWWQTHSSVPLEFDCGMRTNKKKIFSNFFTTTNDISGDNTENVSEYNDKLVRESVEMDSDKKEFYTFTFRVWGPYFDIGVTHKCILVMLTSAWWIINILRETLEKTLW